MGNIKIGFVVFLFVMALFALIGCKTTKPAGNSTLTIQDSIIYNYRNVDVPVPGHKTQGSVNLDSLLQKLKSGLKPELDKQVKSPDGKMNLQYWIDELGKLQIRCETQDYVLNVLAEEITRIRKEQKTETIIHTEYKTPWYNWVIGILLLLALILSLFKR